MGCYGKNVRDSGRGLRDSGHCGIDQQRAPSRRTFLRLAFAASFETFIKFGGNICVRGPENMAPDGDMCILDPDAFAYYSSETANALIKK